jgi:ketosteroid isomerase-like protein
MNNRLYLLLFCLFYSVAVHAQETKKEIEVSIDALNKAMISQDKSTLEKLTANELSYGHSTGLVENKSAFENNILTGPDRFSSIEMSNQDIEMAGNIAIVRNIAVIKGTTKGTVLDVRIGILMIWQRQGEQWKLLARQGYKLP